MITAFIALPQQSEKIVRDIHPPQTSEDLDTLRTHFQLESEQVFIVSHPRFVDKFALLERPDQVHDGCTLEVTTPQKNVQVSSSDGSVSRCPVAWYPRTSGEDIESTISRVIGIPVPLEVCTEQGARLVLASTIPNGTHLIVRPGTRVSQQKEREGPSLTPANTSPLRSSPGPQPLNHGLQSGSHGLQPGSYGLQANSNGVHADGHPPQPSGHGVHADGHSAQPNSHGPQAGGRTPQTNSHGLQAGGHPPQPNSNGLQPGGHSTQANSHELQPDSHGPQPGSHGLQRGSHGPQRASASSQRSSGGDAAYKLHSGIPTQANERGLVPRPKSHGGTPPSAARVGNRASESSIAARDVLERKSRRNAKDNQSEGMDTATRAQPKPHPGPPGMRRTASSPLVRDPSPNASSRRSDNRGRGSSGSARDAVTPTRGSITDEHCIHMLQGHSGFVLCLCIVGDVLFTGSQDQNIMIWDLNNLQYIGTLPGHHGFVKCFASSFSRKLLFSGSQDKTIKAWSLDTFTVTKTMFAHRSDVHCLCILEHRNVLVSGSEDKSIRVWDLNTFTPLAVIDEAHAGGVFVLTCLPSNYVLSGGRDRLIKLWNDKWHVAKPLTPPHYDGVTALAVSAKRQTFYSSSRDKSIKEWNGLTLENSIHQLHTHGDWVTCMALTPDESNLITGSRDCVVKVWDPDTLQCKVQLTGHRGAVTAVQAVTGLVFSGSHDRIVRVWKLPT